MEYPHPSLTEPPWAIPGPDPGAGRDSASKPLLVLLPLLGAAPSLFSGAVSLLLTLLHLGDALPSQFSFISARQADYR